MVFVLHDQEFFIFLTNGNCCLYRGLSLWLFTKQSLLIYTRVSFRLHQGLVCEETSQQVLRFKVYFDNF